VHEDLRERILKGTFPTGSQLPPELDLARTMGVSRTSLREAVQQLELDGLLIRRHGYGTFVRSSPMLHSALNVNQSASGLIRAHGMTPGTRDPQVRRAAATAHEAERLGLEKGEPVVVLERVRTADGRPVVFTRDVIPRSLLTGAGVDIEELADETLSLYDFFADRLGISVVDGTAWIRPDLASKALAGRLNASAGTATLVIEQLDRDATERPVLLTWEHYLADTFEFVIHRRGPGLSAGKAGPAAAAPVSEVRLAPAPRSTTRPTPVAGNENHSRGRTPAATKTRRAPRDS
jgi:DNA-binding GntR family transcriptional regulator